MINRKVVGLFESRVHSVTLITKGVDKMASVCDKCKSEKVQTTAKKTYKVKTNKVVVTNIPCSKCNCDEYFSLDTLIRIESGLKRIDIKQDMFISFDVL